GQRLRARRHLTVLERVPRYRAGDVRRRQRAEILVPLHAVAAVVDRDGVGRRRVGRLLPGRLTEQEGARGEGVGETRRAFHGRECAGRGGKYPVVKGQSADVVIGRPRRHVQGGVAGGVRGPEAVGRDDALEPRQQRERLGQRLEPAAADERARVGGRERHLGQDLLGGTVVQDD